MAAMILQKERSQLGVLALLGLRQASLFICNSNEQKEEFEIHLIISSGFGFLGCAYCNYSTCANRKAWGKRQNVLFIQNNNNNNKAVETLKPVITVVCVLS